MSGAARTVRRGRAFYLFVSPWVTGFVLLTAFPLGYAFWLSLTNTDGLSPGSRFVGAGNYEELLHDDLAAAAIARTAVFTLLTVPASVLGGLLLALLLQHPVRGRGLYRGLIFLPAVIPPVATTLAFKALFQRDTGAVNGLLVAFGVPAVDWTSGPPLTYLLAGLTLWGLGNQMVLSLAALQDVPRDLWDAARIDGAGPVRTFTSVTLPLISPVVFFQLVTGLIFSLQTFLPALLMAPGAGAGSLNTISPEGYFYMIHVYVQYFAEGRFGYASALLWVLFLFTLLCTGLLFTGSRRAVFSAVGPGGGRQ
jgi:multiple sugar transport system permease protein